MGLFECLVYEVRLTDRQLLTDARLSESLLTYRQRHRADHLNSKFGYKL